MDISYDQSKRQIDSFAYRVQRRFRAAGARVDLEDIVQELSIAWCMARDNFNDTLGIPFGAYLARGMFNHINRWAKQEIGIAHLAPFSLDDREDDDAPNPHESVADSNHVPCDEQMIINQTRDKLLSKVDPTTRKFLELISCPPIELLECLKGVQARAEYGRSVGLGSVAPKQISPALVFDIMGLSRKERSVIYKKVRSLSKEVNQ